MGSVTSNRLTYFYPPLVRKGKGLVQLNLRLTMLAEFDTSYFPAASAPIPDFHAAQKDADRITEVYSLSARMQLHIFSCAYILLTLIYQVAAIVAYEGVTTKNRTNRTGWGRSSFKQPATISRRNRERLLARPSVVSIGGFPRAASVSHSVSAADKETRRMREIVEELNLKLDALLAKE